MSSLEAGAADRAAASTQRTRLAWRPTSGSGTPSAPENTDSLDHVRWEIATYPGEISHFLAEAADGTPVGTASTGRIWMHERDYPRFWLGIWVLPEARNRGTGSALYAAISDVARAAGKTGFDTEVSVVHETGHRFLANRGFIETDRAKMVRLDLAGLTAPEVGAPDGIRIKSLAARPDLVPGVHATALEAFPDIPSDDDPVDVGTLEAFTARDVDRVGIPGMRSSWPSTKPPARSWGTRA